MNAETVGPTFDSESFDRCQARAWELLGELSRRIIPGMTEADGHILYKQLAHDFGVEKNWHPPKIRFGVNTTKSFREISEPDVRLSENDIFFLDLGPVFFGHEGDVGQTFQLGNNSEYQRICQDAKEVFDVVARFWREERSTGEVLYQFADIEAQKRGWKLNLQGASGHRIGDFPHAVFHKGSLKDFEHVAQPQRWILEIQLRHPELPFGAFYEDILK